MKSKFKNSGIYCIKNLKENKVYVGSSKNLKNRKNEHFRKLQKVPLNYKVYNKKEETEKLIEDGVIIIPKKGEIK